MKKAQFRVWEIVMAGMLAGTLLAGISHAGPKKHAFQSDWDFCHRPNTSCYSIYIMGPACERAYGDMGTPDKPWKILEGHTWLQCLDQLKSWDFGGDAYEKESTIIDFMQSGVKEPKP